MTPRTFDPLLSVARDRRGGVAVIFGLALLPVVAMAGAAVDFSQYSHDRTDLQRAADAAALQAAKTVREAIDDPPTAAQLDRIAETVVKTNAAEPGLVIEDVSYREVEGRHVVEVDAGRRGVFSGLLGRDYQSFSVRAEAVFDEVSAPAEIAIVMDVTNSMKFGNRWRDATGTIADALERLKGAEGAFYVSLVPFSDRVNIESIVHEDTWLAGTSPGKNWDGCVEPRSEPIGGYPHALDDDAPTGAGRFLPTIKENMPALHVGHRDGRGKLPKCSKSEVVAPTTSIAEIESALNDLKSIGTGRFDEGLVWGWRMLSPKWASEWNLADYPAPYGEREKIVMFFTDGQSTAYDYEVLTGPDEGAASSEGTRDFGHNKGSPQGFAHLVDLCDRMKSAGVRIVMVQLEGNEEHFTEYAKACASSDGDYFYVTDVTTLKTALGNLGLSSGDIRLVR